MYFFLFKEFVCESNTPSFTNLFMVYVSHFISHSLYKYNKWYRVKKRKETDNNVPE